MRSAVDVLAKAKLEDLDKQVNSFVMIMRVNPAICEWIISALPPPPNGQHRPYFVHFSVKSFLAAINAVNHLAPAHIVVLIIMLTCKEGQVCANTPFLFVLLSNSLPVHCAKANSHANLSLFSSYFTHTHTACSAVLWLEERASITDACQSHPPQTIIPSHSQVEFVGLCYSLSYSNHSCMNILFQFLPCAE